MKQVEETLPPSAPAEQGPSQDLLQSYRDIEKKDWWIWGNTVLVMLLLTGAISVLALPGLTANARTFFRVSLKDAVLVLVLLVVFFNVYTIHQQVLIKRLRRQLIERQGHSELLRNLAMVDSLTGLFNRRFAEQRLTAEVSRSSRRGHPLSVLSLDLNKFKEINDTYGHLAGDAVLQEFANRLSKAVRGSDLAVRMGGDEFLVILPDCQAEEVERILARLQNVEAVCDGKRIRVEYSAGWREYKFGDSPEDLVAASDEALYANKRANKKSLVESRTGRRD
jgi:diguanylate cyclase (GGDEF)-like protein